MTQPCEQKSAIDQIVNTLGRMERSQDNIVDLLKIVSNQAPRIENLEVIAERSYGEINELFTRLREAEMNIALSGPAARQHLHDAIEVLEKRTDKIYSFYNLLTNKYSITLFAILFYLILTDTWITSTFHSDAFWWAINLVR